MLGVPARKRKELLWSRRAARDLLEIDEYITREDPAAADRVVRHLLRQSRLLETDALLGKRRFAGPHRELILSRYPFSIIYRVAREAVIVVRVLHQRRQFP
ncbi:MAG: type II toxin-antitoxin system RelE/ParE family toxin [Burkholderiales bacterium]